MSKSQMMGKVGMREFFPSEKRFFLHAVGMFKIMNSAVVCCCDHP